MKDLKPGDKATWWGSRVEIVREFRPGGHSLDPAEFVIKTQSGFLFIASRHALK